MKRKYFFTRKITYNNNLCKSFILIIFIYLFCIFFFDKSFYKKIKAISINIKSKIGNHNTYEAKSKSEKNLIKNNILFNKELRKIMFENGKKYIDKCLNEKYINENYKIDIKPIISVIIPLYNCEKTINASISSIQNQKFTNFEIILINDFSTDKSLNIIQEIQKNDQRIIIVNNEKNMGSLYTRSIGILMAKGAFIFALDNDDMFFDEDLFDVTYKIAIKGGFDIVGFKSINVGSYKDGVYKMFDGYFSFKKNNLIIYQPKLGLHPVTTKGRYAANDFTIWGKCIKTEVYQKAVNALGKERYSMFLSWCEDTSIVFVIFNIAQSYIFIHKYGIFHIKNNSTATKTQSKDNKLLGEIFLLDVLFEFSKNNSNKNIAGSHIVNVKSKYDLSHIKINSTRLYLKSVLEKMLNCSLISKMKHYQIKQIYKKVVKG